MRLCILETGKPDASMSDRFGRYGRMFERWLAPAMPGAAFSYVSVINGERLPEPAQFDGYLITGSRHGAYDPLPWIAPLEELVRGARLRSIPVGGICFGHQIMAQAYGGEVVKHPGGWVLGHQRYGGATAKRAAHAFHQDQVVSLPDGVASVVGNERCAYGQIAYDFPALSVQYHPEFTIEYLTALLDRYGGDTVDQSVADAARATIGQPTDEAGIARDFAEFFVANNKGAVFTAP